MSEIVVLFEVKPTKEGKRRYLDLAAMLKPMLAGFEGFIRAERFSSLNEESKLLSRTLKTGAGYMGKLWMSFLKTGCGTAFCGEMEDNSTYHMASA